MGKLPMTLRCAVPAQADVIRELYVDAAQWLRGKNTTQWSRPWPDSAGRDKRVRDDLAGRKTWIAWDFTVYAGTITLDTQDPVDHEGRFVWPSSRRSAPALYVRRMIVKRSYAGLGLGAAMLDWATAEAWRRIGSPLLRLEVWTDNKELHAYYERQGFELCGYRDPRALPGYPARALFQRETEPNGSGRAHLLRVLPDPSAQRDRTIPAMRGDPAMRGEPASSGAGDRGAAQHEIAVVKHRSLASGHAAGRLI
jgi:GNAT superfamily N-acetyltransferase